MWTDLDGMAYLEASGRARENHLWTVCVMTVRPIQPLTSARVNGSIGMRVRALLADPTLPFQLLDLIQDFAHLREAYLDFLPQVMFIL